MKNKGFTLVELLAVIVILAVIFILIFPAVEHILVKSKETISNEQINTILDAAYDLSLKQLDILPERGKTTYITLAQLKNEGLIAADIKNPETKELYPNNLVISIENVGAGYKYSNSNSKLNGDYLYTVILNQTLDSSLKPDIIFDINLPENSDGNYVEEIDINQPYTKVNYTAESSEGTDLTSRVYVSITLNDSSVESVDTSKLGIYKIYYTVVDDNGYSNMVIRYIIITDEENPQLTLPDNNTLSTSVTEFDLLEGVTCTDNSGVCNITTSGTIKFGEVGKYSITYIAQDSSGNTDTQERIITIE
ncbi:MAG: DUF5011 domain-containing protein [Bacilli bacterium]|nr:DUF5011 domain-containing protein [Bacilli bacterium]